MSARWEGFSLEGHEIPPGNWGDSEFHCHFVAVERGSAPYRLSWKDNGVQRTLTVEPETVFVRSQQPLCSLQLHGVQKCLMLTIDPKAMELALPEPFQATPVELIARPVGRDSFVNHLISAMEAEIGASAPLGSLILGHLANSLALYLAARYSARPPQLPVRKLGLSESRLSRVLEYIHANLASNLSLDELAAVACLSSYHFSRMFKTSTGQSVHQFVLEQRVKQAKTLLGRSRLSLSEVALAVGFCNQSQFTAMFRRWTGAPPGLWRRSLG